MASKHVSEPESTRRRRFVYACPDCDQAIEQGEDGWQEWFCPDHPSAGPLTLVLPPRSHGEEEP